MDHSRALQSVVALHSLVPEDAFTAAALGVERVGSGVVIDESGLILTIGYLITEAENIWLTSARGRVLPGHALAYDADSGLGLVQALGHLDLPPLAFGQAHKAQPGDPVLVAGGGGQRVEGHIVGKQEFAGYWEYLLDEALFIAPAHSLWGGAAVIGQNGKLIGIGSLLMQQVVSGGSLQDINMAVPVDLLPPIMSDLLTYGRVNRPPRPWLGIFSSENKGKVTVADVSKRGPAGQAGVRQGDVIASVGNLSIASLADFYRKLWNCGPAGTEIMLEILRNGRSQWVRVKSADRASFLKKPRLH